MAKLSDEFYRSAKAANNEGSVQRMFESLEEYQGALTEELINTNDQEKVLRLQGSIRTLEEIIDGFNSADDMMRRINRNSEGSGPSLKTIT